MSKAKVGDKAPDFTLADQDGDWVSLHNYTGEKAVVLYFYPKDFTSGCTTETISFGDNYVGIRDMGAEVLGVSSDTTDSHKGFAAKCNVKFPMLSDAGGKVRARYGVPASLGLIPGRVTFIIDKAGVVRHVFSSQLNARKHVSEALGALKKLSESPTN